MASGSYMTPIYSRSQSFGFGLATVLIPQVLSYHFSRHMDKAVGLTFSNECIMFFALSPMTEVLLKTYDLSGTFLILSGLLLHTVPAALLLEIPETSNARCNTLIEPSTQQRESKPDLNTTEDGNIDAISVEDSIASKSAEIDAEEMDSQNTSIKFEIEKNSEQNVFSVFLNPIYILLMFTQCSMVYTYTVITTVIIDVFRDHNVPEHKEVYILMGLAATDAIGRMSSGLITDSGYLTKTTFSALSFGGIGVSLIFFMSISNFTVVLASVLFLQLFLGGLIMVCSVIIFEYVDKEHIGIALASRLLLYMPLSFTQAPLIGSPERINRFHIEVYGESMIG
ncbi:uncharacterized protein TNCV_2334571 [Trichonephila clavipes]|nr:uncharacterized protein TNCV_2334571 [Trichonephila clavipes]